jgi:PPOX class probable F420-dependent enzyme
MTPGVTSGRRGNRTGMSDTQDGPELHPVTRELAAGRNFAVISTMLPSGRIQSQYIWVGTDGQRLYVNTELHRRKFQNLEQDARVTLAIRDEANPYRYAEVRGHVAGTETGQPARDRIDELSQKYEGHPYPPEQIRTERVTVYIEPERQTISG